MSIKRLIEAVRKVLVVLLLLTFFWQTRKAFIFRFEVFDYLIPFVYLSDIFIVLLLVLETIQSPTWIFKSIVLKNKVASTGVALLFVSIVASIVFQKNLLLSAYVYKALKLLILWLFINFIPTLVERYSTKKVMTLLSVGLLPLLLLGAIEMLLGHSLSLKLLGEWAFSKQMPGISTISLGSFSILRPYATFPHPNLFGAVMGIFSIYWLVRFVSADYVVKKRLAKYLVIVFVFGVFISFSRTAWLGLALAFTYVVRASRLKAPLFTAKPGVWKIVTFLVVIMTIILFRFNQLFGADSLSLLRRWELDKIAFKVWLKNPALGVGLNQFLLVLDEYWVRVGLLRFSQPVHNIYLMILAELGGIGLLGMVLVLYSAIVRAWNKLPIWLRAVWIFILVTGLLDHYWWTLQQGLLVLSLTLGFSFASMNTDEKA